jgi:oxalate decarboxylase/phosphoglucose isomerase-like protein (cupin superfamily)
MPDLSARAGLPLATARGRLVLGDGLTVEETGVRRLGQLASVAATPIDPASRRIQYWMYNGVAVEADLPRIGGLPIRYELTALADRPVGLERPKSAGHTHLGIGYAEVCEVLTGTAGFLIQDLRPGPSATYAALVTVAAGEWIVLPPYLHHVTISLGGDPLVFSNVIDRRSVGEYASVANAGGFAWFVMADGDVVANPRYSSVPTLERYSAVEWSGPASGPLYRAFVDDPGDLAWLSGPAEFRARHPAMQEMLRPALVPFLERR